MCVSGDRRRRSFLESESSSINTAQPMKIIGNDSTDSPRRHDIKADPDDSKSQEKHCVQHNYHDHALDREDACEDHPTVSKGGVTVPFPLKLQNMLDHIDLAESHLSDIVSWQPHGRCFLVHKPKEFADSVLPRFFQQKKYASFQRQLNLYGFNRITKGPDRGSYYHELFLRSKKFLCRGIQRMKIKGTGARMASNPDAEPNFYSMTPMGPSMKSEPREEATTASPTPLTTFSSNLTSATTSSCRHVAVSATSETIPPLSISSHSMGYENKNYAPDNNALSPQESKGNINDSAFDFVFDNMPFHSIRKYDSRRHSLLDMSRRNSLLSKRNSIHRPTLEPQSDDEEFFKEMDFISSLGDTALNDRDLGRILEKL